MGEKRIQSVWTLNTHCFCGVIWVAYLNKYHGHYCGVHDQIIGLKDAYRDRNSLGNIDKFSV